MDRTSVRTSSIAIDVERLKASLPSGPPPTARPVLVIVSGLPGTGKSYFSRRLAKQVPLLTIESDSLRQTLFSQPTYNGTESARLFRACHQLMADLLEERISIIFDATNLREVHRERLCHIAEQRNVEPILVQIQAPSEVVHQRLKGREQGVDSEDHSTADWLVYNRMRPTAEPIRRNHVMVDSSRDIGPDVAKVVRHINHYMSKRN